LTSNTAHYKSRVSFRDYKGQKLLLAPVLPAKNSYPDCAFPVFTIEIVRSRSTSRISTKAMKATGQTTSAASQPTPDVSTLRSPQHSPCGAWVAMTEDRPDDLLRQPRIWVESRPSTMPRSQVSVLSAGSACNRRHHRIRGAR